MHKGRYDSVADVDVVGVDGDGHGVVDEHEFLVRVSSGDVQVEAGGEVGVGGEV